MASSNVCVSISGTGTDSGAKIRGPSLTGYAKILGEGPRVFHSVAVVACLNPTTMLQPTSEALSILKTVGGSLCQYPIALSFFT